MRNIMLTLAFALLITLPGPAQAITVAGTYNSTEGAMTLRQQGDRITGRYGNDNGELTGVLYDQTMDGFWIEDSSARRCSTAKNGRYYWGRITMEFTDNGFSGQWGYCNDALTSAWSGTRTSAPPRKAAPPPQSYEDDPFVIREEATIEGAWSSTEGDIRFRQQGNRVSGRYASDNGEIVGSLANTTLRGYWIEDSSNRRCSTAKNGRYHWGTIELKFDGDRFGGRWGYCNDPPSQSWTGQRK